MFRNQLPRKILGCVSWAVLMVVIATVGWNSLAAADAKKDSAAGKDNENTVRVVFVGDVMLDGGPGHAVSFGEDPFAEFSAIFKDADITVCNLECAVAEGGEQVLKPYTFKAQPQCIPLLERYFSAVCLANNHVGDFGPSGFLEELTLLEKSRLAYFGGGHDCKEARQPLVLERKGMRIALLGYNDFPPRSYEAEKDRPGIAWLEPDNVVVDIQTARKEHHADVVIPMLHWGEEMQPGPEESQKVLARRFLDAGADVIIGGHPHVTQTVDLYKGRPIIYSLGNFMFDYFPGDPLVFSGWIVRLTFSKKAPPELEMFAVELDRTGLPHLTPKPQP
jgi:poly-gamma-glutamate synthesis protein (capsule biosynthesis protein)